MSAEIAIYLQELQWVLNQIAHALRSYPSGKLDWCPITAAANSASATELAGERITAKLTHAPGNGAPIGGLKVMAQSGWFAARPSGTEDIHKIYAESFKGLDHLATIQTEAQAIVSATLRAASV